MEHVHLAEEGDLYSGYTLYEGHGESFAGLGASAGGRGSAESPSMNNDALRPMTAIRSAGYSYTKKITRTPSSSQLALKSQDEIGNFEKRIREALKESCLAAEEGDLKKALEKAKFAANQERVLKKQKEAQETETVTKVDTTLSVLVNLALQYAGNGRYPEAIKAYHYIIKCPTFHSPGRFRINLGNVLFMQASYSRAIKFYRMAMDHVSNSHSHLRAKISRNIGVLFLKIGKIKDALLSFEYAMSDHPDPATGLNLVLCAYFLDHRPKMREAFQRLVEIPSQFWAEEGADACVPEDPSQALFADLLKNDELSRWEKRQREVVSKAILQAARVVGPALEDGYEWCLEQLKTSSYSHVRLELEMHLAMECLKRGDLERAASLLQALEREDDGGRVGTVASTNLAFLFFQQNDLVGAVKCSDRAIEADHYNAQALVNKGNCFLVMGNVKMAMEFYKEALLNESSCVEALYNLGLVNKRFANDPELALDCFCKLYAILGGRHFPQVVFQIASTYEALGDSVQAVEWLQGLAALVPTDPQVLTRLGEMFDRDGDRALCLQYLHDAHRHFPSSLRTLEWLGTYFMDLKMYEKAQRYFEKAAVVAPPRAEKWRVLVASCMRRAGRHAEAMRQLRAIHADFPHNAECLRDLLLYAAGEEAEREVYRERLRRLEATHLPLTFVPVPGHLDLPGSGLFNQPAKPSETEFDVDDLLP